MNLKQQQELIEQSFFSHLQHNVSASTTLTIQPSQFSEMWKGHLFRAIQELSREKLEFNSRLLYEKLLTKNVSLPENWWTVFDYEGDGNIDTINHYAAEIRDLSIRQTYSSWLESQLDTVNNNPDIIKVLQKHTNQVAQLQDKLTDDISPTASAIIERMQYNIPNEYFPSGLSAIDANVGGLRHGHLWVISAPYKSRKTSTALNIVAEQLRAGRSVMYIALEDDDQAFLNKLVSIWAGINHHDVDRNKDPHGTIAATRKEIASTNLRIYDAKKGVLNVKNIPALITGDRLRYGQLDLVVIDYIQAYSTRYEELQDIVTMLIRLTAEEQVATLVLSQMNNNDLKMQRYDASHATNGMLSTKGTGDLGSACHVGIEISRDHNSPGELMLCVKVARNGRPQKTFVMLDESTGKFGVNATRAGLLKAWDDNDDLEF